MSKITRSEVEHVAELARLKFTEDKIEQFTENMNAILEYVDKLGELDTSGIEPTSHSVSLPTHWREDVARPGLPPEKVVENAPEKSETFVVVPKVIE